MPTFTQTIIHEASTTCGCKAKVRQTFNLVNDEPVGDPENEVLEWLHRCPFHQPMQSTQAYNRIIFEMRAINYIEAALIESASPNQLEDNTHDDGSVTKKLKKQISFIFYPDKVRVEIPKELKNLEGVLGQLDNFEYVWQK